MVKMKLVHKTLEAVKVLSLPSILRNRAHSLHGAGSDDIIVRDGQFVPQAMWMTDNNWAEWMAMRLSYISLVPQLTGSFTRITSYFIIYDQNATKSLLPPLFFRVFRFQTVCVKTAVMLARPGDDASWLDHVKSGDGIIRLSHAKNGYHCKTPQTISDWELIKF